jgi:hypothetical protein
MLTLTLLFFPALAAFILLFVSAKLARTLALTLSLAELVGAVLAF